VFEGVQDIPSHFGLALVWRENLDRPVWLGLEHIGNITIAIKGYPLPGKHRYIWHD